MLLQFELLQLCAFYQTIRRTTCNTISEKKTHDIISTPVWCKVATSIKKTFLLWLRREIVNSVRVLLRYISKHELLRMPQASRAFQSLKVYKCVYNPMYWLTHETACNSIKHAPDVEISWTQTDQSWRAQFLETFITSYIQLYTLLISLNELVILFDRCYLSLTYQTHRSTLTMADC